MSDPENNTPDPMDSLRKLLFAGDNERIEKIEQKFDNDKLLAQEVASVLAEAVRLRNRQDKKLGKALAPTIEESIRESIAKNPQPLSDSLFPVMGPAIRKSINNAIEEMLQSMTQTMDNAFTVQGLKWRFDSFRTGKSFSEVVLLNTLIYRVEQIFLIHKETGLLLKHISFDPALNEDADVVSSMLTAVRDFVQDSFSSSGNQQIDNLRMGDLEILLEQGPDVVLALVCRGKVPRSLEAKMQEKIEGLQQSYSAELQTFEGDTSAFEDVEGELDSLMKSDFTQTKGSSPLKAILTLAFIILGIISWFGWSLFQSHSSANAWDDYIQRLQNEPGIVVSQAVNTDNQQSIIGLRDPLSMSPQAIASQMDIYSESIHFNFEPYYAIAPVIVLKRAKNILMPPASIRLQLVDSSTLALSGKASESWLIFANEKALFIPGIERVDSSQVETPKPAPIVIEQSKPEPVKPEPIKPAPVVIPPVIKKPEVVVPLTDAEILERETFLLNPPATVRIRVENGILHISGSSSQAWFDFAEQNFMRVRGAHSLFTNNFEISDQQK